MFRQEKPILPFNEIIHLPAEDVRFALNLRKDKRTEKAEAEMQRQQSIALASAKMMQEHVLKAQSTDQFAVKDTGCINTTCVKVNISYAQEYQEVSLSGLKKGWLILSFSYFVFDCSETSSVGPFRRIE
jgi:hypothetical protein